MADDTQSMKSLNSAADLAERQLERAIQVARAAGFESEPAVVAAILQAPAWSHRERSGWVMSKAVCVMPSILGGPSGALMTPDNRGPLLPLVRVEDAPRRV